MTAYNVNLAVQLDRQLDDDQASAVARAWATAAGFVFILASIARDEPWLRVSAAIDLEVERLDVAHLATTATGHLAQQLADVGATVREWLAVEVLHADEVARRARRPIIPPMVSAAQFAELCGVRVQRVYQWESERAAGNDRGFPEPALDGYWLRSKAEHWARTRPTKPGPRPHAERAGGGQG